MNRRILILSVVSLVVILAIVLILIFIYSPRNSIPAGQKVPQPKIETKASLTPAQQLDQIKKNYPEIVQGTINFLDANGLLKTTIKTTDGKVYILWPPQPAAIYETFGAENGGKVQVNGKSLGNGKLSWTLMKPI